MKKEDFVVGVGSRDMWIAFRDLSYDIRDYKVDAFTEGEVDLVRSIKPRRVSNIGFVKIKFHNDIDNVIKVNMPIRIRSYDTDEYVYFLEDGDVPTSTGVTKGSQDGGVDSRWGYSPPPVIIGGGNPFG